MNTEPKVTTTAIKYLLVNITWNSKDWKEPTNDKSKFGYVEKGNIPHESWNFDFHNSRNTNKLIHGFAQFTYPPKVNGNNNLIIFYSKNHIVGFYGKAEVLPESIKIKRNESYNLLGDRTLSILLKNKISDAKEQGFLEELQRVGMVGFSYLKKTKTVLSIIDKAIALNPPQTKKLNDLRQWITEQQTSDTSTLDIKNLKNSQINMRKIDIDINTIFYGPPGTGKTYKLGLYRDEFFTDRGIKKTSEELLKEKVKEYPFWKILGAVLAASKKPLTVNEIVEHRIVKAKVNPQNKTKPSNIAWADLLAYSDDESSEMIGKYRRSIKLFHKSTGSKWSIANDKKDLLAGIIEQDLLDLASNSVIKPEENDSINKRFEFITFHQKYSYEDFIEGITPVLQGRESTMDKAEVGDLQFELKKGVFYNCCLHALELAGYSTFENCYNDSFQKRKNIFKDIKNVPSKQFALFIDEINRANISAVFGELITLLESDKRMGEENEMWLELPYSNQKFCVPPNLFVIGTMNTADRSIALLDIALRRRFEFKSIYPIYIETEWWASLLASLNQAIYNCKKNPDFFIGHAFFINRPESNRAKILNTKIIPLLYEYCQSNSATVKGILTEAGIDLKQTGIKENFQIIAE